MTTEKDMHYFKASIRHFREAPRVKVNFTVINSLGKKSELTWRMTDQKREVWNSLSDAPDQNWNGYRQYLDCWQTHRTDYGQRIKLWIGKLSHRARFIPGQAQHLDRVPFSVALMWLDRTTQHLEFMSTVEQWNTHFEFETLDGAEYNRIYTWQNPNTSVEGRRTRSLF